MIGSLRGKILEKGPTWLLLEIAGIGYRVKTSPSVLSTLNTDDAFLYTHDHVREDAHDLFGFLSLADLELFERLLTISGVGPKSAMTIMSVGSADQVKKAIMSGDLAMLTSVPGVGKKTAQKIVLELKGQLVDADSGSSVDSDVIDALVGLGYTAQQSKDVLKHVKASEPSEKIREALKYLSKA
jgi:Holliday junction DNA helicase RuvA